MGREQAVKGEGEMGPAPAPAPAPCVTSSEIKCVKHPLRCGRHSDRQRQRNWRGCNRAEASNDGGTGGLVGVDGGSVVETIRTMVRISSSQFVFA